jgi:hypothetical protein
MLRPSLKIEKTFENFFKKKGFLHPWTTTMKTTTTGREDQIGRARGGSGGKTRATRSSRLYRRRRRHQYRSEN